MNFTGLIGSLRKRFPQGNEIFTVFSFIVFAVFSWAVYAFLHQMPSSLLYTGLGELAVIFCLVMAIALLESVLVCALIILLCMIFPRHWLREAFAVKGSMAVLAAAIAAIFAKQFDMYPIQPAFLAILAACLVAWIVSIFLLNRYPNLQKALSSFINRFNVFAYIYVPLGIIGIMIILIRNLF
jgi:energy-converting hydrogenase Eha subunit A